MTNLKNILRCYAMGMGIKGISSAFGISRNTVRKYVRKYQDSNLSLDILLSMFEDRIEEMFVGGMTRERVQSPRREALEALLPYFRAVSIPIARLYGRKRRSPSPALQTMFLQEHRS